MIGHRLDAYGNAERLGGGQNLCQTAAEQLLRLRTGRPGRLLGHGLSLIHIYPAVAEYKFNLEDLLRSKPHTLTKAEEKLLASFGEVMSAPSEIYHNLEDADMVFDAVKNGEGETVEVTGSNFVPLEMSTDRTLRENAFHSYYKSYRQHINTFAASYSGAVKAAAAEAAARSYPSSRAMSVSYTHLDVYKRQAQDQRWR